MTTSTRGGALFVLVEDRAIQFLSHFQILKKINKSCIIWLEKKAKENTTMLFGLQNIVSFAILCV